MLTIGSAEGIAKAVLTNGKVMQLVKGPMLDINMPEVSSSSSLLLQEANAAAAAAAPASWAW
jgi:hypothetical protein